MRPRAWLLHPDACAHLVTREGTMRMRCTVWNAATTGERNEYAPGDRVLARSSLAFMVVNVVRAEQTSCWSVSRDESERGLDFEGQWVGDGCTRRVAARAGLREARGDGSSQGGSHARLRIFKATLCSHLSTRATPQPKDKAGPLCSRHPPSS